MSSAAPTLTPSSAASRVAVVGGGAAGLSAAWELARAGAEVQVYEASERTGGAVAPLQLGRGRGNHSGSHRGNQLGGVNQLSIDQLGVDQVSIDAGAEAFATRSSAVADLIGDLGLAERIVLPHPAGAWLQLPHLAAPLPATGVLGIPGDPQAEDVVAVLGADAAARAAEDLRAPMTWTAEDAAGQPPSLGEVVRDRMGEDVVDQLVSPITSGVHSAAPDDLAISAAHPRLFQTMLRRGSLAQAVAELKAAAPAGSAVQSLRGGMHTLTAELDAQLRQAGASIRLNTEVQDLRQLQAEQRPEHIVLAADLERTAALARPYLQVTDPPRGVPSGVALVTMLVRAPELDELPRGTGMLVAPSVDRIGAKSMTHVSAKWAWVADALRQKLGPGHHLLRLSYGRVTDDPDSGALGLNSSDAQLMEAAAADLPALTGVGVGPGQILDAAVVRWPRVLPGASAEHRSQAEQFRRALAHQRSRTVSGSDHQPQLWAVGGWLAGTGLAQVIPDARDTARAILDSA